MQSMKKNQSGFHSIELIFFFDIHNYNVINLFYKSYIVLNTNRI